jgi:hypothetical protein
MHQSCLLEFSHICGGLAHCEARMKRRSLLLGTLATSATRGSLGDAPQPATYEEAVRLVWRPLDPVGGARELVRAATLAANSHNTQPWRFTLSDNGIAIRPDLGRRCPAVDPTIITCSSRSAAQRRTSCRQRQGLA